MAGLTEFYCGWNEPSHASQFKWLEYTFKGLQIQARLSDQFSESQARLSESWNKPHEEGYCKDFHN
jgi:hypothetical protein